MSRHAVVARPWFAAGIAVVTLAAFGAYWRDIDGGFRAPDTLTLIDTSRVGGADDFWRLLSTPLMDGFGVGDGFFRPASSLSYAIDYQLWGLEPSGYILTNLLLHAAVAILTTVVVKNIGGSVLASVVAGLAVALHPIAVESVPAPARRQDILCALFGVAAIALLERTRGDPRRGLIAGSVACLCLSVLSKEVGIAVIFPIAVLAITQQPSESATRAKLRRAGLRVAPYLLALLLILFWRASVVTEPNPLVSPGELISTLDSTVRVAVTALIHPASWLGESTARMGLLAATIAVAFIASIAFIVRSALEGVRERAATCCWLGTWWIIGLIVVMTTTERSAWRTFYTGAVALGLVAGGATLAAVHAISRVRLG